MTKQYTVSYPRIITGNNGEEKTVWPRVGMAFTNKDHIAVKLDSLPIDKDWDGKLFLYPTKAEKS